MDAEKTHGISGYGERCHICHRTVKSLAGLSRHMTLKHPSIHFKPSSSIPVPYPGQLREVILSSQPSHRMEIEHSTTALSIEPASTQPSNPNEIDSISFHHRKFQPLDHHQAPNYAIHPFSDSDSEESSSSDDIIVWSETITSQEGSGEFTKLEDDDPWNLSDKAELEDGFFDLDTGHQRVEESEADTESTVTSTSSSTQIEEYPKSSGTCISLAVPLIKFSNNLAREPWQPFRSAEDFSLARWLVDASVPKTHINRFFNTGMAIGRSLSYTSGDSLWNQIARMPEHLPKWVKGTYTADNTTIPFYYRDIIQVVRYIVGQRAYANNMRFYPSREFSISDKGARFRRYTCIFDSEWAWKTQEKLPDGATLLPLIFASDQLILTTYCGDKKAWPVYMTLGNIDPSIRNLPSNNCYVLIALLPVSAKKDPDSTRSAGTVAAVRNRCFRAQILDIVMTRIMQPIKDFDSSGPGIEMDCADGFKRQCYPIMCSWLSDHEEHAKLHAIQSNSCPKCTTSWREFENFLPSQNLISRARTEAAAVADFDRGEQEELEIGNNGRLPWRSVLWGFPLTDSYSLHRPDLLHNMLLGMIKYLMEWVQEFLKFHNRLHDFDKAWVQTSCYPGFVRPIRNYREIIQWQGKELLNLSKIIVPCLTSALKNPRTKMQQQQFAMAIRATRALIWFMVYAFFPSHDEHTIGALEEQLQEFHANKDVFRAYRCTKTESKLVQQEIRQLQERNKEELKLYAQYHTQRQVAAKRRELEQVQRNEETRLYQESGEFNFVKMHLMLYFAQSIREYGPLTQFNTDVSEQEHRLQVKEGYRRSNRQVDSYLEQILCRYNHLNAFAMRELALKKLAQDGHCGGEVLTTLGFLHPKQRRILAKYHREGISLPPQLLEGIRPFFQEQVGKTRNRKRVLVSVQDHSLIGAHELPASAGLRHQLGHYVADYYQQELHRPEMTKLDADRLWVTTHRSIHLPTVDPHTSDPKVLDVHKIRCTGNEPWFKKQARNDFVLYRFRPPLRLDEPRTAMEDLAVGQLVRCMKIEDLTSVHTCVLLRLMDTLDNGQVNIDSNMPRCRATTLHHRTDALLVNIKYIVNAIHLVPESWADDGKPQTWLINNTIDTKIFTKIY